jgi:hypothetical protein
MAVVTIKISDTPDGKISVSAEPKFEQLMNVQDAGTEWSSAQGMAVWILNKLHQEMRAPKSAIIHLPKLGR